MFKEQRIIRPLECLFMFVMAAYILFSPFSKVFTKLIFNVSLIFWLLLNLTRLKFGRNEPRFGFLKSLTNKIILFIYFNRFVFIFFAIVALSVVLSMNIYHSQKIFFSRYIPYLLFFILGANCSKTKEFFRLFLYVILLEGLILGLGCWRDHFYFNANELSTSFGFRVNLTPYFIFYLLFCFVMFLFSKNKVFKLLGLIAVLMLLPCLIWNSSRSAIIVVFLVILLATFVKCKISGLILSTVFLIIAVFAFPKMFINIHWMINSVSYTNRIDLWRTSLSIFEDFPIFGAGLGMYEKILYQYAPGGAYSEAFIHLHAHSTYLEIAAEAGLAGILSFLLIFFDLYRRSRHVFYKLRTGIFEEKHLVVAGLVLSIFATSLFALVCSIITVGFQDATMFWFMLGLTYGLLGLTTSEVNPATKDVTA